MAALALPYMFPLANTQTAAQYQAEWQAAGVPGLPADPAAAGIVGLYYRPPGVTKVILYAHGNACRLPQMWPGLRALADNAHAAICAYEYPGYYDAVTPLSLEAIKTTAYKMYTYVLKLGYAPQDIILWGRSIGTGPTTELAVQVKALRNHTVGGVVLVTPFASIASAAAAIVPLLAWVSGTLLAGVYDNRVTLKAIDVPVVLVFAKRDEVIPAGDAAALAATVNHLAGVHTLTDHTRNSIIEATLMNLPGFVKLGLGAALTARAGAS